MNSNYRQAADALREARASRQPISPLREWLGGSDLAGAYAVQRINNEARLAQGRRMVGRKIGLTAQAVQRQLGVDQPDFGVLFDDMLYEGSSDRIPTAALIQPKIEGEIAFILAEDVSKPGLSRDELIHAAGFAAPAFEIVDSAVADWKITLADTVADNASCGALVLSLERKEIATLDLRLAGMVMSENGAAVSLGVGAASMGDPLTAFAWLADLAIQQGEPLRRGEIVLTGALGPMVPFASNKHYRLEIAGFAPFEFHSE